MRTTPLSTLSLMLVSTAANALPVMQSHSAERAAALVQMAQATQPAPAVTAAPAEKQICKLLASSYSHSSKRVCLTKEQWKQVDESMRG